MAVVLAGTPQAGSAINATNVTLTFDVAPQENDVVYVFGGPGVFGTAAIVTAGYTEVYTISADKPQKGFRKVMGAVPDTDVVCDGGTDVRDAVAYVAIVLRGVDPTPPDRDHPGARGNGRDRGEIHIAAHPARRYGGRGCVFGGGRTFDTTPGTIAGYSNHASAAGDDTSDATAALATKEIATPGAEDPGAWSTFGPTSNWSAATLAIKPAAEGGSEGSSESWFERMRRMTGGTRALRF